MKVYIAARYSRKEEMKQVSELLRSEGVEVVSTWMEEPHDGNISLNDVCDALLEKYSVIDVSQVIDADIMIMFSEDPLIGTPRGGRHVEFGIALGTRKPIYVVGPKENIFHYLPNVFHFNSINEVINAICY